jgi:hypothetical protein
VDRFSVFQNQKIERWVRIPQQDSAERAFSKLARTFAAQVETLKRYRGGGEQTMLRGGSRRSLRASPACRELLASPTKQPETFMFDNAIAIAGKRL